MKITECVNWLLEGRRLLIFGLVITLIAGLIAWGSFKINNTGLGLVFVFVAMLGYSCIGAYCIPAERKAWEDAREQKRIEKELKAAGKDWKDIHVV